MIALQQKDVHIAMAAREKIVFNKGYLQNI